LAQLDVERHAAEEHYEARIMEGAKRLLESLKPEAGK
jgi:hypothetical protein